MCRMWAAGAAIVLCLATGAPVLAQEASPPAMRPALVSGTETCTSFTEGSSDSVDGVTRERGSTATCMQDMSDPRVSGMATWTGASDCYEGGLCVGSSSGTIEGPDGTWDCLTQSISQRPSGAWREMEVCAGAGAYEGWTYIVYPVATMTTPGDLVGIIIPGPPLVTLVSDLTTEP